MKRALTILAFVAMTAPGAAQQVAVAAPQAPRQHAKDLLTVSVLPVTLAEQQPAIVKAAHNLRAGAVLAASDMLVESGDASALDMFTGLEVKRAIYAGKPLSLNDVGPPTAVARNAVVMLEFIRGPMVITTEGRALDSGAVGDRIRIMNLSSKIILSATITGTNKAVTQ